MFRKIYRLIRHPYYVIGRKMLKFCPTLMSDRYFLSIMWKQWMGYELNLEHPRTFNEKLQWLKLYDRNPLYTILVDKFRVKQYVADKIGKEYVVPTLAVYNSVDEIDLDELPNQFVLKCNHDSGSFVVCKDKKTFDLESAKVKLSKCYNHNYYNDAREWPYKNVKRCIIAETFLEDNTFNDLVNYKFICINGKPEIMYITVKTDEIWENFYDMEFQPIDFSHGRPKYGIAITKPLLFDKMKELAKILAQEAPNVRIDFYIIGNRIFFSEYTFYDWGGFAEINPKQWDEELGELMKLSNI